MAAPPPHDERSAKSANEHDGSPNGAKLNTTCHSGLHDLVNRHGGASARERVLLPHDVLAHARDRDAVLNDGEHDERCSTREHDSPDHCRNYMAPLVGPSLAWMIEDYACGRRSVRLPPNPR